MKYILILLMAAIFNIEVIAQTIGSKVDLITADGVKYTGTIIDKQDGKFKVKYDGVDFEAWLTPNQFIVVNTTATANTQNKVGKFKIGDRVECDKAGINSWEKGTIMPFLKHDFTDGKTYRVRLDAQANGGMYLEGIVVMVEKIRLLNNEPAYNSEKTSVPVGKVTVDANNTLSADRAILDCPFNQAKVKNGSVPNAELCKKLIRCKKGESAAVKGYDGAITIDVTALQIGSPRKWSYAADYGNGTAGTLVYPVKATYTEKVFYRDRTQVTENWIRILNFYVNAFGEWAIGSEESIKIGVTKNVIRE